MVKYPLEEDNRPPIEFFEPFLFDKTVLRYSKCI